MGNGSSGDSRMTKVYIYSAVTNDFETIKPLIKQEEFDYEAYFFTDQLRFLKGPKESGGYTLLDIKEQDELHTSRLTSKQFKVFPEKFLPWIEPGDITVWVDASFKFMTPNVLAILLNYLGDADLLLFPHRWRDCVYEEAEFSLELPKYKDVGIEEQVGLYRKLQYPDHAGLYETGCIVRRNTPKVHKLNRLWWNEIIHYSIQDQVSLPYVLDMMHTLRFNVMPFNFKEFDNHLRLILLERKDRSA